MINIENFFSKTNYKTKRELVRLIAKISDRIFKTTKFADFQEKYSNYYQNDYVLKDEEFSFVHIPRTGGSIFHTWVQNYFTNFYDAVHNAVSLKSSPKNFKYITILRDPIQRVYSYYLMQKKNRRLPYYHHANDGLDFFIQKSWSCKNGMCKFVNGYINKELDQDLYEISLKNLKFFFFIIDYENYINDFNKLMKKIKPKKKIEYLDNFKINIREIPENEKNII